MKVSITTSVPLKLKSIYVMLQRWDITYYWIFQYVLGGSADVPLCCYGTIRNISWLLLITSITDVKVSLKVLVSTLIFKCNIYTLWMRNMSLLFWRQNYDTWVRVRKIIRPSFFTALLGLNIMSHFQTQTSKHPKTDWWRRWRVRGYTIRRRIWGWWWGWWWKRRKW